MKIKNALFIFVVLVTIAVVLYSMRGKPSQKDYASDIEDERNAKNEFMRSSPNSPFAGGKEFRPLRYFPPDLNYQVSAALIPVKDKKMVVLPTTDGNQKSYLEFAYATFTLAGKDNKLLILEVVDPGPYRGTLFLAFADETSAKESYGAGRYLDLKKVPGASSVTLDFNKAYNPYCAYSDIYSCPLPPRENVLKVAIRAGEKSYH